MLPYISIKLTHVPFQLNGTRMIERDSSPPDSSSALEYRPLSPRNVYEINFEWNGGEEEDVSLCDEGGKCRRGANFQWLREEEAVVAMACKKLEDKVRKAQFDQEICLVR